MECFSLPDNLFCLPDIFFFCLAGAKSLKEGQNLDGELEPNTNKGLKRQTEGRRLIKHKTGREPGSMTVRFHFIFHFVKESMNIEFVSKSRQCFAVQAYNICVSVSYLISAPKLCLFLPTSEMGIVPDSLSEKENRGKYIFREDQRTEKRRIQGIVLLSSLA